MSDDETRRREVSLHNARSRYPLDNLSLALTDLQYRFGTFDDYPEDEFLWGSAPRGFDPQKFDAAHPEHPGAGPNREIRQNASAFFWWLAEGDSTWITNEALAVLHRSLFDCSAAVRYDVAMCLGFANRSESASHLSGLLRTESSPGVREVAEWALHGSVNKPYGACPADASGLSLFRAPSDSEITRDTLHGGRMSNPDIFYVLWAAYAWELSREFGDEQTRENLRVISAPTFRVSSDDRIQPLNTARVRAFRKDFDRSAGHRFESPIKAKEIWLRIRTELSLFRSIGYFDGSSQLRVW